MILYTPLSLEDVLFEPEQNSGLLEINYNGKILIVEPVSPFQGKLVRLISAEADDYINHAFQPGNLININLG